nr:hypothetical protein [Scytonema sp. UIC 10036]
MNSQPPKRIARIPAATFSLICKADYVTALFFINFHKNILSDLICVCLFPEHSAHSRHIRHFAHHLHHLFSLRTLHHLHHFTHLVNCFINWFTSSIFLPAPLAILFFLCVLMIEGFLLLQSHGVNNRFDMFEGIIADFHIFDRFSTPGIMPIKSFIFPIF